MKTADNTTSSSSSSSTEAGLIAWLCFVGVSVCILIASIGYCIYCYWRNRQLSRLAEESLDEEVRNGQLDAEMSRIEANIKIFTEKEAMRKRETLRKVTRRQKMALSEPEINEQKTKSGHDLSSGCTICIENFQVDDTVLHSCDPKCPHVFHEHCILSWLVSKKGCPCCLRCFAREDNSPQTSLSSEEFGASMGA